MPPILVQVLWKTYGKDIMKAGAFKLLWSVLVIMGGGCWRTAGGPAWRYSWLLLLFAPNVLGTPEAGV